MVSGRILRSTAVKRLRKTGRIGREGHGRRDPSSHDRAGGVAIHPFLILCYFVAYLDRVNVGFAKLTMDPDLKLSETAFGFGAGVFFLSYFLFEVPSNVILDRVGARIWIARIMFSWGVVSGAMAFIPRIAQATGLGAEHTFYALRFLLGFAEAGFFPGIIFFLTLWFPASYRARIVGYFMAAIPLSSAIGSPVSAALLGLDGAGGLRGWQWLFVIEALPSIILAVVTFFYLTDRPADARWLADDQRSWWGMRSDRMAERTMHLAVSLALAAIGVGASAFLTDPTLKMIALTLGAFGVFASLPIFWTLPTAFLAGAAVAPGIAAINSIGNLSGYFGPFVMGWIKDATGGFAWGLVTIAACAVIALAITLALGHDEQLERAPEAAK